MRRTASEVIRNLEMRVARLERASSEKIPVTCTCTLIDDDGNEIASVMKSLNLPLSEFELLGDEGMYVLSTSRHNGSFLAEQARGSGRNYLGYTFDLSDEVDDDDILSSEAMRVSFEFRYSVSRETIEQIKSMFR